jgi:hypothetical protein
MQAKETDDKVNSQISRLSSKGLKEIEEEQKMWQEELTKLRKIQPSANTVQELKSDGIPTLESQVKEETTKLEVAQVEVEEVSQLNSTLPKRQLIGRLNRKSLEQRM